MFGLQKDSRVGSRKKLMAAFLSRLPSVWESCLGVVLWKCWYTSASVPGFQVWHFLCSQNNEESERKYERTLCVTGKEEETWNNSWAGVKMKLLHPTVFRGNDKLKQTKPPKPPCMDAHCYHMFQKLQWSEPSVCCISLVLKVKPSQHVDMNPCKGHWDARKWSQGCDRKSLLVILYWTPYP